MKKILYMGIIIILMMALVNNCQKSSVVQEDNNFLSKDNNVGTIRLVITSGSKSSLTKVTASNKEDVIGLVVTIENLEVHRTSDSDAGWISLPIMDSTFDLMILDAAAWEEIISQTEIAAGNYNKLRFAVTGALVTTESGIYEAEIPSEVIKINIPFVVFEDRTTEITIDVDPEASLKVTGNKTNPKYKLNPVLKVSKVDEEDGDDTDEDD